METKDLTIIKQEVETLLYENQAVEIKTSEDYTKGGDIRKIVKMKIKKIEDKRKEYTQPLDESKKRIMADFQALTAPLEDFVKKLEGNMLAFYREEQKRLDAEQKKIEAKAMKEAKKEGISEVRVPIVNDINTQRGDVATTTVKKIWSWKLVDINKVPREWLCIDAAKIGSAVRHGGIRQIDGIEIYQEESLSGR